jgi:lipopolysaccharide heptosyltransferase II
MNIYSFHMTLPGKIANKIPARSQRDCGVRYTLRNPSWAALLTPEACRPSAAYIVLNQAKANLNAVIGGTLWTDDFAVVKSPRVGGTPDAADMVGENARRSVNKMNINSHIGGRVSPILIVPYMWIGDFVRCHSVVKLLKTRFPDRPVDMLSTTLCAPLTDYMPGLRRAVVVDLPRNRPAFAQQLALARRLGHENYGTALIMPRTWKSALAPFFAGIPERTGFFGEARYFLLNDMRYGERGLPRMVDRCAALALPARTQLPLEWPAPELKIAPAEIETWRREHDLVDDKPAVALAPGAVGPSKRWPASSYAVLVRRLLDAGLAVWVLGGPHEKDLAKEIIGDTRARDLTGTDLRNAILALAAAAAAVSNDSGLLHVAAALGTPSIGIFGPTSPWHWAPLNPLAATIETTTELACRPCHKPVCRLVHHRCMRDISPERVFAAVNQALTALVPAG